MLPRSDSARKESNPRRGPYKRPALTTELRAAAFAGQSQPSGAEGSRTLTIPLKRRKRYRYATTPNTSRAYAFEPRCLRHAISPVLKLSEVESNHRRRHIRSLCFRYNTGQSGRSESNRLFRAPKARGAPFPFIPFALLSSSYGNRTHLSALKGQYPQADRRTSRR